jgi:hypothetical protein
MVSGSSVTQRAVDFDRLQRSRLRVSRDYDGQSALLMCAHLGGQRAYSRYVSSGFLRVLASPNFRQGFVSYTLGYAHYAFLGNTSYYFRSLV